ncbi:hypothetical protein ELQ88_04560 [Pseudomonas sp. MPC6]|nr:hypothetical protein ELQ88_04560 [Pseudomonas sp. MPC6]
MAPCWHRRSAAGLRQTVEIAECPLSLWERACSRRHRHIQHRRWLVHRFREQARSHRMCTLSN